MNYKQLKIDDPGGTLEFALNALSIMTITRPVSRNRIDQRDIYNALGAVNGEIVLAAIDAAALDNTNPFNAAFVRVADWIKPGDNKGIDICDPEVQAALNTLVGGSVTQSMIDAVVDLSNEIKPKYPNLEISDVVFARAL